jgi:hypothetical protein
MFSLNYTLSKTKQWIVLEKSNYTEWLNVFVVLKEGFMIEKTIEIFFEEKTIDICKVRFKMLHLLLKRWHMYLLYIFQVTNIAFSIKLL